VTRRNSLERIILGTLLLLGGIAMIVPFVWMVSSAFKPLPEVIKVPPTLIPQNPTLDSFRTVFTRVPFSRYFLNSTIVAVVVVFSTLFTSSLAGFAFAKYDFTGCNVIFLLIVSTMMVPFHVIIIPLYIMMHRAGLVDTLLALIIPGLVSAYGIFLMRQFSQGIPDELLDAARIDGASEFRIYWQVVLPLVKPALATLGIFTFMWNWDSFLWPVIVSASDISRTLPLGLSTFWQQYASFYNLQMAASLVTVTPVLIAFLMAQKYFIQGIALTGLKT
jgi:multiple sugar transport system permease protein